MRFIVTTHAGIDGVALALDGHFGGRRFASDADAVDHARQLAKGRPFTIDRERARARSPLA